MTDRNHPEVPLLRQSLLLVLEELEQNRRSMRMAGVIVTITPPEADPLVKLRKLLYPTTSGGNEPPD
jgi:hypothetical protein